MAKILIVDDSCFIRTMLKKYLIKHGHEIVGEADTSEKAIQLYKETSPDIVTLDIVMQDNGFKALDEIISYDNKANIIIVSGSAQPNYIVRAIRTGAKSFLVKPICGNILLKTINEVLTSEKIPKIKVNEASEESSFLCCPGKSFVMTMFNESLKDFGILENDIMIIEKDINPNNEDLVVALYDESIAFGNFIKTQQGSTIIKPGNINYRVIEKDDIEIEILGIIRGFVRIFNQRKMALK